MAQHDCKLEQTMNAHREFTGFVPLKSPRSLAGRITRIEIIGLILASVLITVYAVSVWAARREKQEIQQAAQEIKAVGDAIKEVIPMKRLDPSR